MVAGFVQSLPEGVLFPAELEASHYGLLSQKGKGSEIDNSYCLICLLPAARKLLDKLRSSHLVMSKKIFLARGLENWLGP